MPGINRQQKTTPFERYGGHPVPALQAIEAATAGSSPALAPAIGGAFGAPFRKFGQTDNPGTLYNPYRFRAYLKTAAVSVASGSAVLIPFDFIDDDTNNGWDATNHWYVVSQPGHYAAQIHVNINTTGQTLSTFQLQSYILVSRGGSNVYFIQDGTIAGSGAAGSVLGTGYDANAVSLDIPLLAGDLVKFEAGQSNSANVTLNLSNGGAGGQYTDCSLHLVSGF